MTFDVRDGRMNALIQDKPGTTYQCGVVRADGTPMVFGPIDLNNGTVGCGVELRDGEQMLVRGPDGDYRSGTLDHPVAQPSPGPTATQPVAAATSTPPPTASAPSATIAPVATVAPAPRPTAAPFAVGMTPAAGILYTTFRACVDGLAPNSTVAVTLTYIAPNAGIYGAPQPGHDPAGTSDDQGRICYSFNPGRLGNGFPGPWLLGLSTGTTMKTLQWETLTSMTSGTPHCEPDVVPVGQRVVCWFYGFPPGAARTDPQNQNGGVARWEIVWADGTTFSKQVPTKAGVYSLTASAGGVTQTASYTAK